ncbi:hypothetical protein AK812_SmicGene19418 [Symbiodinium microadriaticum]|uniref:Uncharacterized protein n=1 Tax=Symbiodinium microadriaticum TaxID=2951 RepID=A0A1Q9DSQ7_SYMMI|nr:hypothetical protein AK812_SmicGene19418 [Symbiodinium microadriaticum]
MPVLRLRETVTFESLENLLCAVWLYMVLDVVPRDRRQKERAFHERCRVIQSTIDDMIELMQPGEMRDKLNSVALFFRVLRTRTWTSLRSDDHGPGTILMQYPDFVPEGTSPPEGVWISELPDAEKITQLREAGQFVRLVARAETDVYALVTCLAKYKSWFQLLAAMRAIDHDWTISGLLLDDAEEFDDDDREAGGGAEGDGDEEPPEAADEPQTRSDMNRLRDKFKNNRRTAAHFYRQRKYQLYMRMIYSAGRPLAEEFSETIKLLNSGQVPSLRFQASRASGQCWMQTVLDTAKLINDREILMRLQVRLPVQTVSMETGAPVLLQPDAEENERLEQFWKLLYEICSARCWSQVQYVMLVPNLLAIVWHENRDIRSEGLTRAQHIFDAVFAAETLVYGTQQGETDASKRTVKEDFGRDVMAQSQRRTQQAVTTDEADEADDIAQPNPIMASLNKKSFYTAQTLLPQKIQEFLTVGNLKTHKAAGTESNQRASAATAWLQEHSGRWHLAASVFQLSLIQVYFILETVVSSGMVMPQWMFNTQLGPNCPWLCVPCKLAAPAELPEGLQDFGCLLQQTDVESELVVGALQAGVFLTMPQLQNLRQVAGFPVPTPGSGKGGRVVKKDVATAAVRFFCPECSAADFQRILSGIMGTTSDPACDEDVLAAVQALDPISQEDFKKMRDVAANQLHAQQQAKERSKARPNERTAGDDPLPRQDRKRPASPCADEGLETPSKASRTVGAATQYTPGELRELIPGKGCLAGVYIKRSPNSTNGKVYQGFYPASHDAGKDDEGWPGAS